MPSGAHNRDSNSSTTMPSRNITPPSLGWRQKRWDGVVVRRPIFSFFSQIQIQSHVALTYWNNMCWKFNLRYTLKYFFDWAHTTGVPDEYLLIRIEWGLSWAHTTGVPDEYPLIRIEWEKQQHPWSARTYEDSRTLQRRWKLRLGRGAGLIKFFETTPSIQSKTYSMEAPTILHWFWLGWDHFSLE